MSNRFNTIKISLTICVFSFLGLFFSNQGFSQVGQPNFLHSFTAEELNDKVKLTWTVGTEVNVEKYVIERSKNGIDFNQFISQNSHGNSGNDATYIKFDNVPFEGPSFYRIHSLDYNGDTAFTKTVAFNNEYLIEDHPIFNMYPNPYNGGNLTIEFVALLSENSQIIVTDINGKTIHQSLVITDISTLNLDLSQGVYLVSVLTPSDRLIQKLVVD